MDTKTIIEAVGGRKAVMSMTGLTKGRISQWVTGKDIPTPWLKFFEAKFPELDWPYLRGETKRRNTSRTMKINRNPAIKDSPL